jgi:hypothetical protein
MSSKGYDAFDNKGKIIFQVERNAANGAGRCIAKNRKIH